MAQATTRPVFVVDRMTRSESRNNSDSDSAPLQSSCSLCGADNNSVVFSVANFPANISVFHSSVAEAQAALTGDIELRCCQICGFVWNARYDPGKVEFSPNYEASLARSPTFQSYIHSLCEHLIEKRGIRNKRVLDIGCGDGFFLQTLCLKGSNTGVGIDPSLPTRVRSQANVEFLRDTFGHHHNDYIGDLVTLFSVFEDLQKPLQMLRDLRQMLEGNRNRLLYIEVPSFDYMLRERQTWSVYYEQRNHFSLHTLQQFLKFSGFEVIGQGDAYLDGQYIYAEAVPAETSMTSSSVSEAICRDALVLGEQFSQSHQDRVTRWDERMSLWTAAGKSVVIWGAGGKANSFLNCVPSASAIKRVVDINRRRQGLFTPCRGQQVVAPDSLIGDPADIVLVANGAYLDEIKSEAYALGLNSEIQILD
ncbi:MAG: class I SAM-dependent methyltransferase [Pseudomonadota bacterium]